VIATRLRRPFAASLLAAATVVAALLPPAHIHLAVHDDHDHDHAAIEHSHWGGHHSSRAAFDDDDGRVIFVDRPAVASNADATFARPATAVVALLILPAAPLVAALARTTSGNSPRDGPPRDPSTLRGPPVVL
jgi:hypothetical protein